ncbi:MAG: dihydropteroate synthase [Saprospiraceae bacterium]|nr:dihydropteroate synthase [Saprospiraceae bacterium]
MKQAKIQSIFDPEPRDPLIMGIVNLDPKSFYKSSISTSLDQCLSDLETQIKHGLGIVDIGAFTSRPGSQIPDQHEELKMLMPYVGEICKAFPDLLVSIDTVHAKTAERCIALGAEIINDISGGQHDPAIIDLVAKNQKIFIAMHMKGTPENMQSKENTQYSNIMLELLEYFAIRISKFQNQGLTRIIIDPGIGFSKTLTDNYKILSSLSLFQILDVPLLIGLSRKSMFWKPEETTPENVLPATIAANTLALMQGCRIIRVHDVWEHAQCVRVISSYREALTQS